MDEGQKKILDDWLVEHIDEARNYIKNGCFLFSKLAWDDDLFGQAIINLYNYIDKGHTLDPKTIQNILFVAYRNLYWMQGKRNGKKQINSYEQLADNKSKRLNEFICMEEEEYTENPLFDPLIYPQLREDIITYLQEDKYVKLWDKLRNGGCIENNTSDRRDYFIIKMFLRFKYLTLPKLKKLKQRKTHMIEIYNPNTYELEAAVYNSSELGKYMSRTPLYKEMAKHPPIDGNRRVFKYIGYIWDITVTFTRLKG